MDRYPAEMSADGRQRFTSCICRGFLLDSTQWAMLEGQVVEAQYQSHKDPIGYSSNIAS
jgi:hypothetical protein